jgi:hypothetical protein
MNYSKAYLTIFIFASIFTFFIIWQAKQLQTTWTGIYTPSTILGNPYNNEYSSSFFTKDNCQKWAIKQQKIYTRKGTYRCGKNCQFTDSGLFDCEKIYLVK